MKHVFFDCEDIITYNDHIAIFIPFETEFKTSVRFEDLWKVIHETLNGESVVNVDMDNNQLLLSSDNIKVGLATVEEDQLGSTIQDIKATIPSEENGLEWLNIPEDLITGIELCSYAASSNMMEKTLTCVQVKGNKVTASDNLRVSRYDIENEEFENHNLNFLIQAQDARELAKFPFDGIYITDSWCHFVTEDLTVFSSRLVSGDYLNFDKFFDKVKDGTVEVVFKDDLKSRIESMIFMADGETKLDKVINIELHDGKMICEANKKNGWIKEIIDVDYKGEKKLISINPIFLSQVLSHTTTIYIGDTRSYLESGNFKHILMHKMVLD